MEELAEAAGITVRTLRFYRERKLHPAAAPRGPYRLVQRAPPRPAAHHRRPPGPRPHPRRHRRTPRRLRDGRPRRAAELLGLEGALAAPWSEETPVRLTPEELADHFGEDVTPENLTASLDIGYISPSTATRSSTSAAACWTPPPPWSARACRWPTSWPPAARYAAHADALADLFTRVIRTHVLPGLPDPACAPPARTRSSHRRDHRAAAPALQGRGRRRTVDGHGSPGAGGAGRLARPARPGPRRGLTAERRPPAPDPAARPEGPPAGPGGACARSTLDACAAASRP